MGRRYEAYGERNRLWLRYAEGGVVALLFFLLAACGGVGSDPRIDEQGAGLTVVKADSFSANTSQGERAWVAQSDDGASGDAVLQALPEDGKAYNSDFVRRSPRLDYEVSFDRAGTYHVWVRGRAIAGALRSSNSVHVGLNGKAIGTADRITGFDEALGWTDNTMDGERATFEVSEAGTHTLNVWMREDGFTLDALILTPDAGYAPKGRGPVTAPGTPDTSKPQIFVTKDASRRSAQLLDGQSLSGDVYIYADNVSHPTLGAPYKVQFFIDGEYTRVERAAPYDLRGGGSNANPYDTSQLTGGTHKMRVKAYYRDGSQGYTGVNTYATFTVQRDAAPDPVDDPAPPPAPTPPPSAPTASGSYYVSCSGDDSRSGTSPEQAWRTLDKANRADLKPGEALLLERGCTWQGPLKAAWRGTGDKPITIAAYGSGAAPIIQDASQINVDITGSHLLVEGLETRMTKSSLPTASGCSNQPYGWRIGFAVDGSYITLRDVKASRHTAGVHISEGAHHNRVLRSTLINNTVMSRLTRGGDDDSGAWGLLLNGDDNEVAYNTFSGNKACSFDYGADGASIEVYKAKRNNIHHNVSQDQVFSELGGKSGDLAEDNYYSYNLFHTEQAKAEFLIVRGSRSSWGPTLRTKAFHNTVYLPNSNGTQGVVCHGGCSASVLTLKNNILWVGWKTIFADAPFDEAANIYWRSGGDPLVQMMGFSADKTSMESDPKFAGASQADFALISSSPAINRAVGGHTGTGQDLTGRSTLQDGRPDIGAFEY